jgi:DnaJ domain
VQHVVYQMNYYAVLHVPSSATYEEIKNAYRKAARIYHPDKQLIQKQNRQNVATNDSSNDYNNESGRRQLQHHDDEILEDNTTSFRLIQEAWECLRDTNRRKQYDNDVYFAIQAKASRITNAIIIYPSDCIEQEYCSGISSDDDSHPCTGSNSNNEVFLLYTCRCGYIINTSELACMDSCNDDDDDTSNIDGDSNELQTSKIHIQCAGCSLRYILFVDDDVDYSN